ncbi:DEAD/DEAH box helicase family protein [Fructobacillus sp. M158]|uniref:helicase-related protein n=1 Tax=Fructobacillus parabroussonetiae TaxID=2713174 RepID=UPI00200AE95C|nr:helicase-related protein [Fructobacillus parabroussonetiae]MCK8617766.1 DEAD/DEAH box helicase family protein [Fructobacillus parabroussonetiae]
MEEKKLYGRLQTWPKNQTIPPAAQVFPVREKGRCFRCHGRSRAPLPNGHSYCLDCLMIGRVSSLDCLLTIAEPNDFPSGSKLRWQGQLTREQQRVSDQLLKHAQAGRNQLLWAVTGAGKTEMLFPLVDWALSQRQRVAIIAPRVDVVLELAPRIQAAFDVSLQVLYGDQEAPYDYSQLVVATAHQLFRFYRAFDLVIIDEVDAFPFRGNQSLQQAVTRAAKADGCFLYLTATPDRLLQRQIKAGKIALVNLPKRFHGGKIPGLTLVYSASWPDRFPKRVLESLKRWLKDGKPFFIFVPTVADLARVWQQLEKVLPKTVKGATVHANDSQRVDKVQAMRAGDYDFLLTTTILERGVTLANLQVLILGADDPTFTTEALVQMAGRVGRDRKYREGEVLALAKGPSRSIRRAEKMIRHLNQLAEEDEDADLFAL